MDWKVVVCTTVAFLISIPTTLAQGENGGSAGGGVLVITVAFGIPAAIILWLYMNESKSSETTSSEESDEFNLKQTDRGLLIEHKGETDFDDDEKLWVRYNDRTKPFDDMEPSYDRDKAIIRSLNANKLKVLRGEKVEGLNLMKKWSEDDIPVINNPDSRGVGRAGNTSHTPTKRCPECDAAVERNASACEACGTSWSK
jgi:hypothetical protein